jgi:hypothetical protein
MKSTLSPRHGEPTLLNCEDTFRLLRFSHGFADLSHHRCSFSPDFRRSLSMPGIGALALPPMCGNRISTALTACVDHAVRQLLHGRPARVCHARQDERLNKNQVRPRPACPSTPESYERRTSIQSAAVRICMVPHLYGPNTDKKIEVYRWNALGHLERSLSNWTIWSFNNL